MQAATEIRSNHGHVNSFSNKGTAPSWLSRMFGCQHRNMSRPFSADGQTYCSCLDCGARRQFDVERWEMQGGYYYGSPSTRSVGNSLAFGMRPNLKLVA